MDECDVLLAVWDGKPAAGRGGTAEIVAYALKRRVPVVAIPTRGGPLEVDLGETDVPTGIFSVCGVDRTSLRSQNAIEGDGLRPFEVTRASQRELEHYNRTALGLRDLRDERFARAVADERNRLPLADLNSLGLDDLAAWILPYYVRADRTARAYQRWYYGLVTIEFVAAALAVLVVAAVSQLWRRHGRLIAIEMVLLILVLAVVYLGRHLRLNRRWLTSRFLAERFRSALFLKAAGLGAWHEPECGCPAKKTRQKSGWSGHTGSCGALDPGWMCRRGARPSATSSSPCGSNPRLSTTAAKRGSTADAPDASPACRWRCSP